MSGDTDTGVWEVRLGMYATEQQATEVKEQIKALLCPDPDHASPCPIPWAVALLSGPGLDGQYEGLVEQAELQNQTPQS